MRKPRPTTFLLAAIFVVAGFNNQAWLFGRFKPAAIPALDAKTIPIGPVAVQPLVLIRPETRFAGTRLAVTSANFPVVQPLQLSDDATALVAEMCDLQLLAHGTALSLSSRQWSAFAAVVLHAQTVQQTYEAQIATSKMIALGRYHVEIPAYATAGDLLREKFNAELCAELGQATAADVLANLGGRLEARFAGFGVSVQTLDITGNPGGGLSDVEVTRMVTYWNSVEGSDDLATRRETHFPAFEDPTGDSWSALLAMVKA